MYISGDAWNETCYYYIVWSSTSRDFNYLSTLFKYTFTNVLSSCFKCTHANSNIFQIQIRPLKVWYDGRIELIVSFWDPKSERAISERVHWFCNRDSYRSRPLHARVTFSSLFRVSSQCNESCIAIINNNYHSTRDVSKFPRLGHARLREKTILLLIKEKTRWSSFLFTFIECK